MKERRMLSLTIVSMLVISILLVITSTQLTNAAPDVKHTATVSPAITTVPQVKYVFNVTNLSNATEKITSVTIAFPQGFQVVNVGPPSGWTNNTGWPTITFGNETAGAAIAPNSYKLFNLTVVWPPVPPTTAVVKVNCSASGTQSINNPKTLTITFNPQFTATITPLLVQSSKSYNFNITVRNIASSTGLGTINITYPADWTFNAIVNYGGSRPWSAIHDAFAKTFKLWGPNLLIGEYVWILVNMTTQSSSADPVNWFATAWDISGTLLGTRNLPVTVDGLAPTVNISAPESGRNYSVGFGKRIWINGTVSDDLNITKYGLTLTINDTRFERIVFAKGANHFTYNFAFANKTAIPDGKLAIKITATDASGRIGSGEVQAIIDNAAPKPVYVEVLDQGNNKLPFVSGVYWMGADTRYIKVKAAFYDPATPITGRIYLNSTWYTFENETATSPAFNVTGSNYVVLKITLVDSATPTKNNFTRTWEIKRDMMRPSLPTYTIQPICGGAIIRALNATDNVGVLRFNVYVNGTPTVTVDLTSLHATTLTSVGGVHRTFNGILVLNLTSYAGKTANITIAAVDYGANEGPRASRVIPVPKGKWYPMELYAGWNLVSLPLIPSSTATSSIYSLILKQGAAGVTVTYGFDNTAKSWVMNPTTMVDGKGYWIHMKDYDVLIVQGLPTPEPPALPTTYHLPSGWCLAGFTGTTSKHAHDYLESLEPGSYFRWLYVWDAATQSWTMVDTKSDSTDSLSPGQAFWIYLYQDQDLIPPIP